MANIQSGINQLLGYAGIARQLSKNTPRAKNKAEETAMEKQIANSQAVQQNLNQAKLDLKGKRGKDIIAQKKAINAELINQGKLEAQGLKYRMDKKPSQENTKAYLKKAAEISQAQAQQRSMNEVKKQLQQKQNYKSFRESLTNSSVTIGGQNVPVKDLPPQMQKKIEESYSPAEKRKYLADQKRNGEKNGNQ